MKLAAVLFGLMYTLVCEAVAFMMVGAGHGWLTPFFWGPVGFIVFPLCFYAAMAWVERGKAAKVSIFLGLIAAIAAKSLLFDRTVDEGVQYFDRVGTFAYFWIALWLGGQLPVLYAIGRRALEWTSPREA